MKAKTQIRIGLWGAILLTAFGVFDCLYHLPSSFAEILYEMFNYLFTIIILVFYIVSIVRKKLRTTIIAYRIWWISCVVLLWLSAYVSFLEGKWAESFKSFITEVIMILYFILPFGFVTLILWMGIRGLKRMIETENEQMGQKHFV
jgi:hypothetical protein